MEFMLRGHSTNNGSAKKSQQPPNYMPRTGKMLWDKTFAEYTIHPSCQLRHDHHDILRISPRPLGAVNGYFTGKSRHQTVSGTLPVKLRCGYTWFQYRPHHLFIPCVEIPQMISLRFSFVFCLYVKFLISSRGFVSTILIFCFVKRPLIGSIRPGLRLN